MKGTHINISKKLDFQIENSHPHQKINLRIGASYSSWHNQGKGETVCWPFCAFPGRASMNDCKMLPLSAFSPLWSSQPLNAFLTGFRWKHLTPQFSKVKILLLFWRKRRGMGRVKKGAKERGGERKKENIQSWIQYGWVLISHFLAEAHFSFGSESTAGCYLR